MDSKKLELYQEYAKTLANKSSEECLHLLLKMHSEQEGMIGEEEIKRESALKHRVFRLANAVQDDNSATETFDLFSKISDQLRNDEIDLNDTDERVTFIWKVYASQLEILNKQTERLAKLKAWAFSVANVISRM